MARNELETKIIAVARKMFIQKGYAETNMSDIAAELKINRPTLHYYYRTKEILFEAVFGDIISSSVNKIRFILSKDESIINRISKIIDSYFEYFIEDPDLPLFLLREFQRNSEGIIRITLRTEIHQLVNEVETLYNQYINEGKINDTPFIVFLMTFYSLLICPFVSRNILNNPVVNKHANMNDLLTMWKPYVVKQVTALLNLNEE